MPLGCAEAGPHTGLVAPLLPNPPRALEGIVDDRVTRIVKENDFIPAMLRTVKYENVTKDQLRGIIEDLKSGRYKKAQPDR
jgi:hypothetical protein